MSLPTSNTCVYTVSSVNDANSAPFVSKLTPGLNATKYSSKYFSSSSLNSEETNCDPRPSVTTGPPTLNPLAACFIPQLIRPLGLKVYESDDSLDETPPICNVETPDVTPDVSFIQSLEVNDGAELRSCQHDILSPPRRSSDVDLNPFATSFVPILADIDFTDGSPGDVSSLGGIDAQHSSPNANPFDSLLVDLNVTDSTVGNVSILEDEDDPQSILDDLKKKNIERPVIAHLNINSISSKFEPLMSLVKDNVDLLVITESKIDDTFPMGQFQIEGFARPIRLDRNRNGGGGYHLYKR